MSLSDSTLQKAKKYELLDPDVRLMMQVREGSAAAFEQLVEKHQHRLVMILNHLISDRIQAEDLAQEVLLRVYRARNNYVPSAKFSTWLYTITHNVASNALRKSSRRKEVNLTTSPSGSMPTRQLDTMAKDKSALMPARQLDRNEMATILHEAINALVPRQRMAMMLSRFEGMSYLEIGESMELTTQAVKSLLSRARTNLRTILQPYVDSGQLPSVVRDERDFTQDHE